MNMEATVRTTTTTTGEFIRCPVCRKRKLLRLQENTRAENLALYCGSCKRESVVDIQTGKKAGRVTLRRIV